MIALEDLKDWSEESVKEHIASQYSGYNEHYDRDEGSYNSIKSELDQYDIVLAYESVGSWGCDSSSYFVLKNKTTGEYFDFSGSHCSCYGFEGQYGLNPTTLEALKLSADKGYVFSLGGYDSGGSSWDSEGNTNMKAAIEYIKSL